MGLDNDYPRPRRGQELTPGLRRHVVELYESGMSRAEVAKKLDISTSAVYRAMKAEGVKARRTRSKTPVPTPPSAGPISVQLGPLPTGAASGSADTYEVAVSVAHPSGVRAQAVVAFTGTISPKAIRRVIDAAASAVDAQLVDQRKRAA
jgi:transposase-like protein